MPYVNGIYFSSPGAKVAVNDQNFQAPPNVGGQGVLLIGPVTDGQPNTPLSFSTPAQALATLKGGDGLQGVLLAFSGASKAGGSTNITFIRPELAMQATSTIASSSAVSQIVLTTLSYGTVANSSKWQVTAGTTGYNVSIGSDFAFYGASATAPTSVSNLSLAPISIQYTGTGASPTYTVSDSELVLTATGSDTGGTIPFTSTMTVQQLVNQINQLTGWVATVTDPNPNDLVEALFDNVATATAVGTTSATSLTANVTAAVRWINAQGQYFTATRQAGAASLAASSTWTYATGGTTPTAANSDWQNAYTTAQSVTGIGLITPVSSTASLWAMNDAHCQYMASIGQPRRGYVGDASGQTLATELTAASTLNSNRTTLVWPEQYEIDYNGNNTLMAPYLVACVVMGERSATVPYNALTQQPIVSQGMGITVAPSVVGQALSGGIAVIAPNQSGTVVLQQDRTTWLQNTAYDKVENSTGMVADIITSDLQSVLQTFVGKPVANTTVAQATSAVYARLVSWSAQGFLASEPKLSDVSLQGQGDTIVGTAQAAIDVPANYIALQLYPTALS